MNLNFLLKRLQITQLNAMQETVLEEKASQVLLLSPTGSGKTLAFLCPLLKRLDKDVKGVQAIIISPTRELALQIEKVFRQMTSDYKILCCYGGHSTKLETNSFTEAPAVLVGTPGRLAYHIDEGNFDPLDVSQLILDEFDKSLELGFQDEIGFIIGRLKSVRYQFLASATALKKWPDFLKADQFKTLNFLNQEVLLPNYVIAQVEVASNNKLKQFLQLVMAKAEEKSIVFVNTRETADDLFDELSALGLSAQLYHGGLDQLEREKSLIRFRNGSAQVLLTTDLGARGLDIAEVQNIIHFELPRDASAFLHRNGRTARMQAGGKVYVFKLLDGDNPSYFQNYWTIAEVPVPSKAISQPKWETLYFSLGKKDKINKVDVLGFLTKTAQLTSVEVGIIEIKDHAVYVAVLATKTTAIVAKFNGQKIKGKKVKIAIAS